MGCDLTEGNVTKNLLFFAGPMILGNLLQQFYNIVDTWVVGQFVGSGALAAVGSAYSIMTFLNSVIIGLCMGAGAAFSYYYGKRDMEKFKSCVRTSFVLIGVLAVSVGAAAQLLLRPVLMVLQTPQEVFFMLYRYLWIVLPGMFFVFLYNYFSFLLRSMGNSVTPLMFLGIAAAGNVMGDLLFVLKFHWGLEGTAVATVAAQAVSGIGLGIYTWRREKNLRFSLKEFMAAEKPVAEILKFSGITCMQQSVMNFGILMIQGLVNRFGAAVMAAFAAAVKIDTLAYMPAQEFGNAYSMFISQNFGAGKRTRLVEGTKKAAAISAVFCAVISVLVTGLAPQLMRIFVTESETQIIATGVSYLRVEGAFYIGIGILFLLYGYFRGKNLPQISLLLTVVSLGSRVVLAYLLAAIPFIGVNGIWWSIPIGWALADLTGVWCMRKKRRKGEI